MRRFGVLLLVVLFVCGWAVGGVQYVVLNRTPGGGFNQGRPESMTQERLLEVTRRFGGYRTGDVQVGVSCIISYLNTAPALTVRYLERFLECAEATNTPVVIKLDGECWWGARPDLWNWWDPNKPGYDPGNRDNVERTGWDSKDAVKIAWRNWGRQIRILPPPNLMSPRYRQACKDQMDILVPMISRWWKRLPADKKDLLIGVNVGWESSIGVNAWYYPDGNSLLDKDPKNDPQEGLKTSDVTARGQVQIGYAAVKTAGIKSKGTITERDLYEVVRRHMEDLSRQLVMHGLPREKIFTHGAAWKDEELLYDAAVNKYSCPGWSFYKYARDPSKDKGVRRALTNSDAPYWSASEWLMMGSDKTAVWKKAIENTLADDRCRFVCIYNWEGIRNKPGPIEAIRQAVAD